MAGQYQQSKQEICLIEGKILTILTNSLPNISTSQCGTGINTLFVSQTFLSAYLPL